MIDVARLRRETPGAERVCHLNNAGSALPPQASLEAVVAHLELEAAIGGYEAGAARATEIEAVYGSIGRLTGAARDEIAFIESATRAWDMAFYGLRFRPGDRIITGMAEYASNAIAMLQVAARTGARVEICPDDESGQIDVAALERMLDDRVRLIAVVHAPTQGGLLNPAAAVGRVARAAGIPYLLDACQSLGQLPVDVNEIGCDMLSATGRKFLRGPRGTGFLYVRRSLIGELEPPMLDLHAAEWTAADRYETRPDARRFETWERSYACMLGLGAAIDYALEIGIAEIGERARGLAARLRAALAEHPRATLLDRGAELSAIVTFTLRDEAPAATADRLRAAGVNVSVSRLPSARYDLGARGIDALVRASPHAYNTEAEIDRLLERL